MTNFSPRGIFENCDNLSQQVTMGVTRGMSKVATLGYLPASFTADAQSDVDFLGYNPTTGDVKKVRDIVAKSDVYVKMRKEWRAKENDRVNI